MGSSEHQAQPLVGDVVVFDRHGLRLQLLERGVVGALGAASGAQSRSTALFPGHAEEPGAGQCGGGAGPLRGRGGEAS